MAAPTQTIEPVPSADGTYSGYFVIADISGYTGFLANNDLAHAHGILSELTTLLIDALGAPFRFVELEGDAVFVFAPAAAVQDSERLIEILEVCYARFRKRLEQMQANTSCECTACARLDGLDLKCVAHFGSYAPQETPTGTQLIGPDVILVHRLLKNTVAEATGVTAYALVTEAFLQGALLQDRGLGLIEHSESYPELGAVRGGVLDLTAAIDRYREQTSFYVSDEDADILIRAQFPATAQQLWPYFLEAERRLSWQLDTNSVETQAQGRPRMGVGVESHCDHGAYRLNHRIVDFQPFHYVTMESSPEGRSIKAPPGVALVTFEFTPLRDGGTQLSMRLRLVERGLGNRLKLLVGRRFVEKEWAGHYQTLARVLDEEKQRVEDSAG